MLEVIACFVALAVVLLFVIAKFCHEIVVELKSLQELIWSKADEPVEELIPEQIQEVHRMINHMFEVELAKQRSKFWNGH